MAAPPQLAKNTKSPSAVKEATFTYEATDKIGKKVKGQIAAVSEAAAKTVLRRQGLNPLKVAKKESRSLFAGKKSITSKDITIFSRQLATMMSAGVPLVQAFEIIGRGHDNPSMEEMILTIKSSVESGSTLTDALTLYPLQFDELYLNLVKAGESAGILETLLHKIATYKEKIETLKGKIKKALFYPTAVIIAAFVISAILLIFVIPQFKELFQGFGADLPAFTQFVINLSEIFQAYWWLVAAAVAAGGWVFTQAKMRSRKFNHFLDRISLKVPVFGELIMKATIARFARTLATMFAAGVPLVDAMESVAGAAGNIVYSEAILQMRNEVATGQQLQSSMREAKIFPNMVIQMVAIGEESGALDTMLGKVADFYEEEVDNMVDSLSSLMEPMIMAFLGTIVGGLVVAMYLPIFKMGAVV